MPKVFIYREDWYENQEPSEDVRDKTPLQMVREYQKVSGQEPDPELYLSLVEEEVSEWTEARILFGPTDELKELTDLVYVIYGYANARGWDLDQALLRVHDNNMGRMYQPDGTIQRREDGKVLKNEDYPKVNLSDLV